MYCTLLNGTMGSVTDVAQCMPSGFVYLTAQELSALLVKINTAGSAAGQSSGGLTVAELFAVPSSPDLATIFMQGFSLPLVCYLTAWAYGLLISFIEENHE